METLIKRFDNWEIQTKGKLLNTDSISFIVRHHRIERLPFRSIVMAEISQGSNISLTSTKKLPAFIITAIRSMTSELIQDQITA